MNAPVIYSVAAICDLDQIWDHHAEQGSIRIADEIEHRIKSVIDRTIARHPRSGRRRPEFGPDIHSLAIAPFVVFYRIRLRGVQIVRILHGHRDIHKPLMSLLVA